MDWQVGLRNCGVVLSQAVCRQLFNILDHNNDGTIDYEVVSLHLAATVAATVA